ncbi:MAG: GntR family transcriptional regulator [Chitinivibrionales bacterium]|nr:GntR family transcriptional regulator [Chitinivibrionales bacterium]
MSILSIEPKPSMVWCVSAGLSVTVVTCAVATDRKTSTLDNATASVQRGLHQCRSTATIFILSPLRETVDSSSALVSGAGLRRLSHERRGTFMDTPLECRRVEVVAPPKELSILQSMAIFPSNQDPPTRAVRAARAFLLKTIESYRSGGRPRLPTVRELARTGRFSTRTVVKALQGLRRDGYVHVRQRAGIRILEAPRTPPPELPAFAEKPVRRRRRWEQLRDMLLAAMLGGEFPAGSALPTVKELCHRYGVGFVTVKKALQELAATGKLVAHGRGYRVFGGTPPVDRAALVFVGRDDDLASLQTSTPSSLAFWQATEDACERRNLDLVWTTADDILLSRGARRGGSVHRSRAGAVLGYVVWSLGFQIPKLELLLQTFLAEGKPVSVIDEGFAAGSLTRASQHPLCQVIAFGFNPACGETVGNYLLSIGHRRVACLQVSASVNYCVARASGVHRAYCTAGLPDGVLRLTVSDEKFARFDRGVSERMSAIHRSLGTYEDPGPGHVPNLHLWVWGKQMRKGLIPLFDRALADETVTAWVTMNDPGGFAALDYLRFRGVRVPQDISVISFDNSLESFGLRLTSYSFNMPAVVGAVFEHILHPPQRAGRAAPVPLHVPGRIMVRDSTAPLGKRTRPGQ